MTANKEVYYQVGKSPFLYAGYQCNNNCIFCFEAGRFFPKKTTRELKKEIDIIRKKFDFINFMGQEPTLRNDLIELIAYAKSKDFKQIGLTTNGRMFAYNSFAEKILKSGLNQIGLTVVGNTSKMHDAHTSVKGSFEQSLKGIRNILSYKPSTFSFLLNLMITRKNYKQLVEIVNFYADLGIKEINIGHIMPLNKKIKNSKEIIAEMKDVVPLLVKSYNKYKDDIKFLFVEYPACVFEKKHRYMAFPCLEENPEKKRISICRECKYRDKCSGISKYYLNLYGKKEFKL